MRESQIGGDSHHTLAFPPRPATNAHIGDPAGRLHPRQAHNVRCATRCGAAQRMQRTASTHQACSSRQFFTWSRQAKAVIAAHCIIIILSHAWSIRRNKSCQLIKDDGFPKPSRLLSYPTCVQSAPYSTYRVQDSICSKRIPFPNLSHHAIAMWKAWPTYPCPPRTHLSIIPVSIKSNQALTRSSLDLAHRSHSSAPDTTKYMQYASWISQ